MLTDFVVQFFDQQPRRETALYLLLTGKKTLSVLFAALQHDQLHWLQLYPTLSRTDFQAAIAQLEAKQILQRTDAGLVLVDEVAQAGAILRQPLPKAYQPWMGLPDFGPKFTLAVQMLSEASYHNARYRPVTQDWAVQQTLRRWWQQVSVVTAVAEFKQLLIAIGDDDATVLLSGVVGHDFVGSGRFDELAAQWRQLQAQARMVMQLDQHLAPTWQSLWGGRKPLGTKTQYAALAMIQQGATRAQVSQRLHLKPSTINEHLLTAALFGADLPLASFYDPAMLNALQAMDAYRGYQALLAEVSGSDFFQIRLFQILSLQGRWPRG